VCLARFTLGPAITARTKFCVLWPAPVHLVAAELSALDVSMTARALVMFAGQRRGSLR